MRSLHTRTATSTSCRSLQSTKSCYRKRLTSCSRARRRSSLHCEAVDRAFPLACSSIQPTTPLPLCTIRCRQCPRKCSSQRLSRVGERFTSEHGLKRSETAHLLSANQQHLLGSASVRPLILLWTTPLSRVLGGSAQEMDHVDRRQLPVTVRSACTHTLLTASCSRRR